LKKLRVLSLFDGISTGRLALEKAGIPIEVYYASEVDKNASAVSEYHYPDIIRLGDVTKIDFKEFKDIDLILSGSPCVELSRANRNRQGIYGEHSNLFFYFIEALETIKPKWFLQENVASMKVEDKQIMTEAFFKLYKDTRLIEIDSALVSAQSRKRLYWTNLPVCQPKDCGIFLTDILEDIEVLEELHGIKTDGCVKYNDGFVAINGKRIDFVDMDEPYCLKEIRTEQGKALRRAARIAGKKDTTPRNADCKMFIPRTDRKANCLTTTCNQESIVYIPSKKTARYLTPLEWDRLQTMGDDYTKFGKNEQGVYELTNSARYKALGNGWTADVIAHIFKGIVSPVKELKKRLF